MAERPAGAARERAAPARPAKRATILVVAENEVSARAIHDALSLVDRWTVIAPQSRETAVAAIKTNQPDLLVLGLHNRQADIDFALDLHRRWELNVVYLTGAPHDMWASLRQTRPLACLGEPFRDPDLRVAVEIALQKVAEEREQREDARRAIEAAAQLAATATALEDRLAHIGLLVAGTPPARNAGVPIDSLGGLLTRRERQVVERLLGGGRVAIIARDLGVSMNTVRSHLRGAFRKLEVHSQAELIALLQARSGLFDATSTPRRIPDNQRKRRSGDK